MEYISLGFSVFAVIVAIGSRLSPNNFFISLFIGALAGAVVGIATYFYFERN